jgi:hypothetical protein
MICEVGFGVVLTELAMWIERRLSRWQTHERERF